MPIPLNPAIAHPTQPGVMLTELAVEELHLTFGSAIDAAARISVKLKPCAPCMVNGVSGFISAPNLATLDLSIPDVYAWVAARAGMGDMQPATVMGALVAVIGAEYARQHPEA